MADVERRGPISWLRDKYPKLCWAAAGLVAGAGTAWLLDLTDQTAPLWTFIGVVVVALLTVATAESRHDRQLEAESVRLRQQLEAESTRHAERLEHERSAAAREDNVTLAEEALRAFREADQQMRSLEGTGAVNQWLSRALVSTAIGRRPLADATLRTKFVECRRELESLDARMAVRLRRDSKQLVAFRAATKEFRLAVDSVASIAAVLGEPPEGGPDVNQILNRRATFTRRVREFEDAVSSQVDIAAS